jgi:hypothetical protein
VYEPLEEDIERGSEEVDELLERMAWHFDNDKWDHTREYYTNDGIIPISLE